MRVFQAGLLLLFISASAFAQAEGEVEVIGFQGNYRPNCWTGMRLRLKSKVATTETYKISVIQQDLDRDRVIYSRPFTLTGNQAGEQFEDRVWVYFIPQPYDIKPSMTPAELTSVIRVFLCTESGKQLVQLPITSRIVNLDDYANPYWWIGTRLVLVLKNTTSNPILSAHADAHGINEEIAFVSVLPNELPGSVLAYSAVDAIVWDNVDPAELRPEALSAILDYVRDGGRMLVTQGTNWQKIRDSELHAALPVTL